MNFLPVVCWLDSTFPVMSIILIVASRSFSGSSIFNSSDAGLGYTVDAAIELYDGLTTFHSEVDVVPSKSVCEIL